MWGDITNRELKLTDFCCHAEPEGEASGFIGRYDRFSGSQILRFTTFRSE